MNQENRFIIEEFVSSLRIALHLLDSLARQADQEAFWLSKTANSSINNSRLMLLHTAAVMDNAAKNVLAPEEIERQPGLYL